MEVNKLPSKSVEASLEENKLPSKLVEASLEVYPLQWKLVGLTSMEAKIGRKLFFVEICMRVNLLPWELLEASVKLELLPRK